MEALEAQEAQPWLEKGHSVLIATGCPAETGSLQSAVVPLASEPNCL